MWGGADGSGGNASYASCWGMKRPIPRPACIGTRRAAPCSIVTGTCAVASNGIRYPMCAPLWRVVTRCGCAGRPWRRGSPDCWPKLGSSIPLSCRPSRSHHRCDPPFATLMRASCSCSRASGGTPRRRLPRSPGTLPPRNADSGSGMSWRRCTGCGRMALSVRREGTEGWRSSYLVERAQTLGVTPGAV